jgi:hypothetical protein
MFKQANSEPLASSILQTLAHNLVSTKKKIPLEISKKDKQHKSPRLQNKEHNGKTIIKKAQELVARKCGILEEEDELDEMTLQQYLNMYKNPLNEEAMEAITKLSEVAVEKKIKKKDKKKKKGACSRGRGSKADGKKISKKDNKVSGDAMSAT